LKPDHTFDAPEEKFAAPAFEIPSLIELVAGKPVFRIESPEAGSTRRVGIKLAKTGIG
jgi:hypothetical protein